MEDFKMMISYLFVTIIAFTIGIIIGGIILVKILAPLCEFTLIPTKDGIKIKIENIRF